MSAFILIHTFYCKIKKIELNLKKENLQHLNFDKTIKITKNPLYFCCKKIIKFSILY